MGNVMQYKCVYYVETKLLHCLDSKYTLSEGAIIKMVSSSSSFFFFFLSFC